MNKNAEYKNIYDFIKKRFPNNYQEKNVSNDVSLETFMKNNSEIFKVKINNIINDNSKTQTALNKR
jgi:hypothetical protein